MNRRAFLVFSVISSFCLGVVGAYASGDRREGVASWMGMELYEKPMANGKPFYPWRFTCASWHYPFGTLLRVTHVEDGKFVDVVVTDRGPSRRLNREIDLSEAAFKKICPLTRGLCRVTVKKI